ncbi:MAG TPA: hypothetical protein VLH35_08250, partial [Candidatus Acidoferrales bacterium]|nr:hypothetical protein [Candidatus Acidoferrales bacterium]
MNYTKPLTITIISLLIISCLIISNSQLTRAISTSTSTVTFIETGLASGTRWSVVLNGATVSSTTNSVVFTNIADGTYSYSMASPGGYIAANSAGSVTVSGSDITVSALFYALGNWTYGGAGYEYASSIVEVSGGGFALVGYTYPSGSSYYDVLLVRVDSNGNQLWNKTYGGTQLDFGYGVVEVSTGGFALTGATSSYGPGFGAAAWLIRVDSNGDALWNQTYGGLFDNGDEANNIIEYSGGGFA